MMRILLFLATNIAVMIVISILFNLLGISGYVTPQGLDLKALLIGSAIIGMTGSFISLAISKMMAKRSMGVQVIDQPQNQTDRISSAGWRFQSVSCLRGAFDGRAGRHRQKD